MLSLVRGGPWLLLLQGKKDALQRYLADVFSAEIHRNHGIAEKTGEGQTVVYLVDAPEGRRVLSGTSSWRSHPSPSARLAGEILCHFVNDGLAHFLAAASLLPRILLFRLCCTCPDTSSLVEELGKDFHGTPSTLKELLRWTPSEGTVVCFTTKPLNRLLLMRELLDQVLVLPLSFDEAFRSLQPRALELFNESMGNKDWNEVLIHVYDKFERYEEHLRRVELVLEAHQTGFVLGEGWGTDTAHILLPVRTYRLRLLTFHAPERIKSFLMGLEYSAEGERFLDIDLYCRRRKISWTDSDRRKGASRETLGRELRKELMESLPPETRAELESLEKRLLSAPEPSGSAEVSGAVG